MVQSNEFSRRDISELVQINQKGTTETKFGSCQSTKQQISKESTPNPKNPTQKELASALVSTLPK